MKTDSKIAIGISSVLVAVGVLLFLWILPLIFTWLAYGGYDRQEEISYLKKAIACSIFKWQKLYTLENILPSLLLAEKYDEAIMYFERMEKDNIETSASKFLVINAYIKQKKYDKALQLAKEIDDQYKLARIYIETNDLANAKKAVEKIFSTKKKAPNAYLYVAEIQLKEGHPKSALQSIDKLLAINPKHIEAIEVKAKIYEALGQKTNAEAYYLKAKQRKDEFRQKYKL